MPTVPYYTQDGKRRPSVTTILNEFKSCGGLMYWSWECGTKGIDYRDQSAHEAHAGTLCHAMIEAFVHNAQEPDYEPYNEDQVKLATKGFEGFLSWHENSKITLNKITEQHLVSEEFQYGGTLDQIAEESSGELVVLDWKCANGVYPEFICQVSGYCRLWSENNPDRPIRKAHLLRVGKRHADFHHHHFPEAVLEIGWKQFWHLRKAYDLKKQLKRVV